MAVVLRAPGVPRLLASSLAGRLPTAMVPVALVLFARGSGRGYGAAGWLAAAYAVGTAVGGPLLARLVDRSGQSRVLVASAVGSGAALALLPLVRPGAGLVAAAVAGALAPPLEPCLRSLWPFLLPVADLASAYAVDAAAQELVFVAGPLLVLGATGLAGARGGLTAAAAVGLGGALWFASAPASRGWAPLRGAERHWAGALRSAQLRLLYVVVALVGTTAGVLPVCAVAYAERHGSRGFGAWVVAANAVGALLGGLVYSTRAGRGEPARLLAPLAAALAVGYLPLALQPPPVLMLGAGVLSGVFLPPVLTRLFQVTDALAPPGTTTEAFAWLVSAFLLGSSAGAAWSGVLCGRGDVGPALLLAALSGGLAAVTAGGLRAVATRS